MCGPFTHPVHIEVPSDECDTSCLFHLLLEKHCSLESVAPLVVPLSPNGTKFKLVGYIYIVLIEPHPCSADNHTRAYIYRLVHLMQPLASTKACTQSIQACHIR